MLRFVSIAILTLFFCIRCLAQTTFEYNDIEYNILDKTEKTCEVAYQKNGDHLIDVSLPAEAIYKGVSYKVVNIANYAFLSSRNLSSITIPESITSIGDFAFTKSTYLRSISIPESVIMIGEEAFSYSGISSIKLPSSLITLGSRAFYCCDNLTEIFIQGKVTDFGELIFDRCVNLQNIEVDGNNPILKSEDGVLYSKDMKKLIAYPIGKENSEFVIPSTITTVGARAFALSNHLRNVRFPQNLSSIEEGAFFSCDSIDDIVLPEKLVSIGDMGLTGIGIKHLRIPMSVKNVGNRAFAACSKLENVFIPDTDISLGDEVFLDCVSLKTVRLPNTIASIPNRCFANCYDLISLEEGESIISVGDRAFEYCHNLRAINFSKNLKSIGNYTFLYCGSLKNIELPETIDFLGNGAFCDCYSLKHVNIPSNLECIPDSCFEQTAIEELILPENITSIGRRAFSDCYYIKDLQIPASVGEINNEAFFACVSLENIEFRSISINIGKRAFDSCDNLTELRFFTRWLFINDFAFKESDKIKMIYSTAPNPGKIPRETFSDNTYENCELYVPEEAFETYANKDYWSRFKNIKVYDYGNDVEEIETRSPEPEIFDLNGRRVDKNTIEHTKGVYIIRKGNKSRKIII